jgi:hypothetical protein
MLRRPMRSLFAAAALALFALTGCKGSCRQLAEKLCDCQPNTTAKDACLQTVSSEESRVGTSAQNEQVCATLVDKCDCHTVNTTEGKRNCGLAR